MTEKMLRIKEVAKRLGVDPVTMRRWLEQGKGPAHIRTPGKVYLFDHRDVESWLNSLRSSDPSEDAPDVEKEPGR